MPEDARKFKSTFWRVRAAESRCFFFSRILIEGLHSRFRNIIEQYVFAPPDFSPFDGRISLAVEMKGTIYASVRHHSKGRGLRIGCNPEYKTTITSLRYPRLVTSLACGLGILLMASCTSLQAPVEPPVYDSRHSVSAEDRDIRIDIMPIEGNSSYEDLFEEDLPRLGIAAAWVSIRNMGSAPVDLRHLEWFLYRNGIRYKELRTNQLLSRYYKARNIRAYTLNADQKARLKVEKLLFRSDSLTPGALEDGFVYFEIDPAIAPAWIAGGFIQARDIRLEDGSKISIEVHFAHVDP